MEVQRVFLYLSGDGTGVFLVTYHMAVTLVDGDNQETIEAVKKAVKAYEI